MKYLVQKISFKNIFKWNMLAQIILIMATKCNIIGDREKTTSFMSRKSEEIQAIGRY